MKHVFTVFACLILSYGAFAQKEFPIFWKGKFSFSIDRWFYDANGKYVIGRTDDDAEMLDGLTGKSMWTLNFKKDLQLKNLERATYNTEEAVVLFFDKEEKKKKANKVCIDFNTGKELWRTNNYPGIDNNNSFHFANNFSDLVYQQTMIVFDDDSKKFVGLNIRTGEKKWESAVYDTTIPQVAINEISGSEFAQVFIYTDEDNYKEIFINITNGKVETDDSKFTEAKGSYTRSAANYVRIKQTVDNTIVKLIGKMKKLANDKITFELLVSGDNSWTKTFEGKAVRQIFSNSPYVKLDVQNGKIFVLAKNITVFDIKTGNQLWEVPFDNCDASAGLRAKQEFGIAGWPLAVGNDVYYVDLAKDNVIKKVDATTGKVIWKSESFKSNDRVPNLLLHNGILLAQFGGMINTQIYISTSTSTITKNENRFDGNYEVRAYDAKSGTLMWNTSKLSDKLGDKFSDRISSIYLMNNKLYVASDKNLFCLEPKDGAVLYKTPLAASKIGDVFEVLLTDDLSTFRVFCDNGVAAVDVKTGKLNYATETPEIFWKLPGTSTYSFRIGENFFIWVGEDKFVGFDLTKGIVKGMMKDNSNPQFTDDGNYIFLRDGSKFTKYSINN